MAIGARVARTLRQARAAAVVHTGAHQRDHGLRPGRAPHGIAQLHRPRRPAAVAGVGRDDHRGRARTSTSGGSPPAPGSAILTVVLAFNFLGDGLRDALDVRRSGDRRDGSRCSRSATSRRVRRAQPARCTPCAASTSTCAPARSLALVGESGSGKSVIDAGDRSACCRRHAAAAARSASTGRNCSAAPGPTLRALRGRRIGDDLPGPDDLAQPRARRSAVSSPRRVIAHQRVTPKQAEAKAIELLELVSIPDAPTARRVVPARAVRRHAPAGDDRHGHRQRSRRADRRRADHRARRHGAGADPRAARSLRREREHRPSCSITHDLGVVAGIADRVPSCTPAASSSRARSIASSTDRSHPYTRGLLASLPRLDRRDQELTPIGGRPAVGCYEAPAGCAFHPRCPHAVDACPATSRCCARSRRRWSRAACRRRARTPRTPMTARRRPRRCCRCAIW